MKTYRFAIARKENGKWIESPTLTPEVTANTPTEAIYSDIIVNYMREHAGYRIFKVVT
jgi:hypothetical protein